MKIYQKRFNHVNGIHSFIIADNRIYISHIIIFFYSKIDLTEEDIFFQAIVFWMK